MRRIFWMAFGAAVVTLAKRWTVRTAAAVIDQYAPAAMGKRVVINAGQRVDAARREGKAAMVETEQRLRAKLR